MATIGTITVGLTAKTDRFKKKMKKASATVSKFGRKVGGVAKKIAKFGAVMAGAAVAGMTLLMRRSLGAIDTIAKLSDQVDISTEALTGWAHAAELTGTEQTQLNKGLVKMVRNIGDAKSGISTGTKAFEDAGIAIEDLQGKSNEQIFEMVADKIGNVSDASKRASMSMGIFGKAGGSLLNMFTQGKEGIAGMRKEAEELGLTYNRIDASKVEAFNDAWTKATAIFTSLGNALAVHLAPIMTELTNRFTEGSKEAGGMGEIVGNALKWIASGIGKVINLFDLFKAGLNTLASGALTLGGVFARVFDGIKGVFLTVVGVIQSGIASMLKSLAGSIARVEEFAKNTVVRAKFAVGLLSDFERAKAEGRNREDKRARVKQIVGAAGGLEKSSAANNLAGGKLLDDAITGRSSKLFDDAAKVAATSAITAFDRYQAGAGAKETAAWFKGVEDKAAKKAEDTVAAIAKVNVAKTGIIGATATKATPKAAATAGSFNVAELAGSRAVTTQEKQLKQQKDTNKKLDRLITVTAESGGLA